MVVLVNKWDLIEKDNKTTINFEKELRAKMAPFNDVEIIFTSALTKQRLLKALESAIQTYENRKQKLKTSELNRIMLEEIENFPPPSLKGKYIRIIRDTTTIENPNFRILLQLTAIRERTLQAFSGKQNPGTLEVHGCTDSNFYA